MGQACDFLESVFSSSFFSQTLDTSLSLLLCFLFCSKKFQNINNIVGIQITQPENIIIIVREFDIFIIEHILYIYNLFSMNLKKKLLYYRYIEQLNAFQRFKKQNKLPYFEIKQQ